MNLRISNLIVGISMAIIMYFIALNQDIIFGRTFITTDEFQILTLVSLIILYSILASFGRYRQLRLVLLPFFTIVTFDIIFKSLLFFGYPQYYLLYQTLRIPLAIFVGAVACSYITFTTNPIYQSSISAISLTLAGVSSYVIFSTLSSTFDVPSLAVPSLVLFVIFAITAISNAFEGEVAEWIRKERPFLLLILFILTVYVFIRPVLANRPGIANFFEWMIVVFTLLKLSRDLKRSIELDTKEVIRAHRMENDLVKDKLLSELEFAEKAFIEEGYKVPLIVSVVRALGNSGIDNTRIESIVAPLVNHRDENLPLLAFPWEKKIIEHKNKTKRVKVVEELQKELEEKGLRFKKLDEKQI